MRTAAVFALVAACGFRPSDNVSGGDGGGPGSGSDMGSGSDVGSGSDMGSGSGSGSGSSSNPNCYGTGTVVCPAVTPTGTIAPGIGLTIYSTDPGSSDCIALDPPNDAVCVVAANSISYTSFVFAHGQRPLVILSLTTLDVGTTIDVGSSGGALSQMGPGADPSDCTGTNPTATGGGGYGGSFGSIGGGGASAIDGAAGPVIVPTALRGGCLGGQGAAPNLLAQIGHGGGAIDLIANSISITGAIDASGEGGGGGGTSNGGNGGGAGGMIVLDAPFVTVTSTGQVYANGGGGGGGGGTTLAGGTGNESSSDTSAATAGGAGGFNGGAGGSGATATDTVGAGGVGNGGGANGGGGGGLGVIQVLQATGVDFTHFSPHP